MAYESFSDVDLEAAAAEARKQAHGAPKCLSGTAPNEFISGDAWARHSRAWMELADELDRRRARRRC